jgi:hypothetical protein
MRAQGQRALPPRARRGPAYDGLGHASKTIMSTSRPCVGLTLAAFIPAGRVGGAAAAASASHHRTCGAGWRRSPAFRAGRVGAPLYQQGGLVATQVLLLRRGRHWQYAAMVHDGSSLCMSTVFGADRFSFTPAWRGKYQPRAAEAAD